MAVDIVKQWKGWTERSSWINSHSQRQRDGLHRGREMRAKERGGERQREGREVNIESHPSKVTWGANAENVTLIPVISSISSTIPTLCRCSLPLLCLTRFIPPSDDASAAEFLLSGLVLLVCLPELQVPFCGPKIAGLCVTCASTHPLETLLYYLSNLVSLM